MSDAIVNALLGGSPWAILLFLGAAYVRLQKRLDEVQDKRTSDAQAVVQQIFALSDKQNEMTSDLIEGLSENTRAISEMKEVFREFKSTPRR